MVEINTFVAEGINLGNLMAEKIGPHSQGFCYLEETKKGEGIYYGFGTTILVNGNSLSIAGENNIHYVRKRLEEILGSPLINYAQSGHHKI